MKDMCKKSEMRKCAFTWVLRTMRFSGEMPVVSRTDQGRFSRSRREFTKQSEENLEHRDKYGEDGRRRLGGNPCSYLFLPG
jgi:hypothetical protein